MNWNWRDEGFRAEPKRVPALPGLRVYRAWGGPSKMMGCISRPGVCFSTQKPNTRSEAEQFFSAWEWGNSCLWLTEFRVMGRTELYVGTVHTGDFVDVNLFDPHGGVQVFIENPIRAKAIDVQTMRLADDIGGRQILPGSRWSQ